MILPRSFPLRHRTRQIQGNDDAISSLCKLLLAPARGERSQFLFQLRALLIGRL